MRPEGSATYLQAMTERAELGESVPVEVRRSFERIRDLHVYGLFNYPFFTLAEDAAWLLPESALGVRFIERYDGVVPFARGDERAALETRDFRTVAEAVSSRGRFSRRVNWHVVGHGHDRDGQSFDASYRALMRWAHKEGLLTRWLQDRWQAKGAGIRHAVLTAVNPPDYAVPADWGALDEEARERWWERWRRDTWEPDEMRVFVDLRNLIAHSPPGRLTSPVNSAAALASVADFINALWPSAIPGESATE